MMVRNYFETWYQAFGWLTALSDERREGSALRRSASKEPKKRWMVLTLKMEVDPEVGHLRSTYPDQFDPL